jgi:hypothetical protein
MKFTRIKKNKSRNKSKNKSKNKSRKGGAPKTMQNNLQNCENYWQSYSNIDKCSEPWMNLNIYARPVDIIDYPGIQNKMMGKKPTWLPETSTTGLARNMRFKDDLKIIEKMNIKMIPNTEVPKEFY